jgi:hypothetical protein
MERRALLTALALMFGSSPAAAQVRQRGYTRRDGTHVAPAQRSRPDRSRQNNYSTRGNVNPHTGQRGTQDPNRRR